MSPTSHLSRLLCTPTSQPNFKRPSSICLKYSYIGLTNAIYQWHHPPARHFSTTLAAAAAAANIETVPVKDRKDLHLQIHYPRQGTTIATPTILHIPFHATEDITVSTTSHLLSSSACIVLVPTRHHHHHPPASSPLPQTFPHTLHDASGALDTLRSHFPHSRTGLYGAGFSGSLALSLAATDESVSAVAVTKPIANLFSLGPVHYSPKASAWLSSEYHPKAAERKQIFGADPTWWTDPFASPLFWVRTRGVVLPMLPGVLMLNPKRAEELENEILLVEKIQSRPKKYDGFVAPTLVGLDSSDDSKHYGAADWVHYMRGLVERRAKEIFRLVYPPFKMPDEELVKVWAKRATEMAQEMVRVEEGLEGKTEEGMGRWLGKTLRKKDRTVETGLNAVGRLGGLSRNLKEIRGRLGKIEKCWSVQLGK